MAQLHCSTAVAYGPDPRQRIDVLIPEQGGQGPLLVLLHAGWWRRGHRQDLLATAVDLAERGQAVALLGYRLLQGSRRGDELVDDVVQGLRAAVEEAQILGAAVPSLVMVGSGAGGLLGLCALPRLAEQAPLTIRGLAMVGTAPGLQPWPDCPAEVAESLAQFAAGPGVVDPIHDGAGDLPPMLLIHGDQDEEVPARLAQTLHGDLVERSGASTLAIIAGAGHRFLEDPASQAGRSACSRIVDWLAKLDLAGTTAGDGPTVGEPAWLQRR